MSFDSIDFTDGLPYYKRISYHKKKANNFKWVEECAEYIDRFYGQYTNLDYADKLNLNYDIAKGRGEAAMSQYQHGQSDRSLIDEGINVSTEKKKHFDILSPIFKSMSGEMQKRDLIAVASDISGYAQSLKKKKNLELYQQLLGQKMAPLQQEATQEIFLKHKIDNPQSLAPEEQKQIKFEIDELMKFKTPKDIDKFMRDDYKAPAEHLIQNLVDWYIREFDLKFKTDEAFKHLLLSGREIAHQTIQHYKPYCKILNPKGFTYYSEQNTFHIEDGEWWKYEEGITYSTMVNEMPEKSLKQMHDLITRGSVGSGDGVRRHIRGELPSEVSSVVAEINTSTDGAFLDMAPKNMASREGQSFISSLFAAFGNGENSDYNASTIRRALICYTAFTPVYYIRRKTKGGDLEGFWVGENYTKNKEKDYDVTKFWAKEYWQCKKVGSSNGIYYDKERVPFQNRSLSDPFKIIPPFVGVEYSRLFNNSPTVAPIDFGKPYQYEYNLVKNKQEELEQTNIGKVMFLPESFIPKDWSMGKFAKMMKLSKFAPINENSDTLNPAVAAQIMKSVDLSNTVEVDRFNARLDYIRRDAELAMSYSPSQLGTAPASMTATNNQQNIIQGSYKTEDIFALHNTFVRNLLNSGVTMIKNSLRDNKELREQIASDLGIAILEAEFKLLEQSDPTISIINDTEEIRNIESYKNLLQPMVQNGLVSSSDSIKIQFAKNSADLINLAEESERKAQKSREAQQKREQEEADKQRASIEKMAADVLALDKYKFDTEQQTRKEVAAIDATKFQRQADADANNIPDVVQNTLAKQITEDKDRTSDEKMAREKNETNLKIAKMKPAKTG